MQYRVADLVDMLDNDIAGLIAVLDQIEVLDRLSVLLLLRSANNDLIALQQQNISDTQRIVKQAEILNQIVIDTDVA